MPCAGSIAGFAKSNRRKKILRGTAYLAGFLVGYLRLRRYLSGARRFNLSLSVLHTAGHSRRLA